ncbi:hypothetical protein [Anaerosinus gibii]|uniref:Uncharacterized protein n=1 Tax=Selenobaculum gibii TaxID=3054208 RepID=A0A9Y2AFE6_9FIRM|nr:hypothetical protein [Selenobaculum gbiensis]WIW70630.1 hypothetical protein P3F81_12200 [Selenobaculum gbiensis]
MDFTNVESFSDYINQCEDVEKLVNVAIMLDGVNKNHKKMLDMVKAKLQSKAIADIENKNIKYVKFASDSGSCEVSYKTKFEVDNYEKLKNVLDNDTDSTLAEDKIMRKLEVKYDVETRFKQALIAICKGDYKQHNIHNILISLGLDDKAAKVAKKKLKGDYASDKNLLESFGCPGELEEELDAIKEAKNYDLIARFFDLEKLNVEEIKKAIWLEESLSLTLNSNKAG